MVKSMLNKLRYPFFYCLAVLCISLITKISIIPITGIYESGNYLLVILINYLVLRYTVFRKLETDLLEKSDIFSSFIYITVFFLIGYFFICCRLEFEYVGLISGIHVFEFCFMNTKKYRRKLMIDKNIDRYFSNKE